jgi:hypothetical protein
MLIHMKRKRALLEKLLSSLINCTQSYFPQERKEKGKEKKGKHER